MSTIPASTIVNVNPGVVSTGGSPLSMNGVALSQSAYIPTGTVESFDSPDSVGAFFGLASVEYAFAQTYFLANDNSSIKPGTLYIAPYVPTGGVAAWLQSGNFAGVPLSALTSLSAGTLTLTIDGTSETSASINLSSATSFSQVASMIATGFAMASVVPTVVWDAIKNTFIITSPTLGASSTITVATTDALATGLKLTVATGAVLSQGDVADTPATAMANVVLNTQNWALFTTIFEPDLAGKTAFAVWVNGTNQRYGYIVWDTNVQATQQNTTTTIGYVAKTNNYNGVCPVYNTLALAALFMGTCASINFLAVNGRITFAFKSQTGFTPTVTNQQIGDNLLANGYSFYGAYATANEVFNWMYNGQISGVWQWLDTFVNQIYLNSQFQLALATLLGTVNAVSYNAPGYGLIRNTLLGPINDFISFGGIQKGVTLSSSQRVAVNQAAGADVAGQIETSGYYLQILDPGAQVRGQRKSPIINFWYTDGGAIQFISMNSIDIL